jgi:hypothetical protein
MMCPLLIIGRNHVEFRYMPQAREDRNMENSLKARTPSIAMARAEIERMKIISEPRR